MQPLESAESLLPDGNDDWDLQADVLVERLKERGAKSKAAQARRCRVNRTFYFQMLKGVKTPSLKTALRIAAEAETTVDDLWKRRVATAGTTEAA